MEIKVYGREGCQKCSKLKEKIQKVAEDYEKSIGVEKVTDMEKIVDKGFLTTPVVTIDGETVFKGKIPRTEEIKSSIEG